MDVVEGLLRIKRVREDRRQAELRTARGRLQDAAQALRDTTAEAERCDVERHARQDALYGDVCSRIVRPRDLDHLRLEIEVMKEEREADLQRIEQATQQRDTRRNEMDEAAAAHRRALQAVDKFDDLAREQRLAREAEAERMAELELEEHAGRWAPLAAETAEAAV